MTAQVSGAAALPAVVERVLRDFVTASREAFGSELRAVVLFGSAAEGRLRLSSDVNVVLVLRGFDAATAERLAEPMRTARAAINLRALFLLE